ncbi:MAG: phosphatase PAP2 family protein [Stellaceae bacterium]
MRCRACIIWIAVVLLSILDVLLCHRLQLHFTNWGRLVAAGAVTAGVTLYYRLSGRSARLANLAQWALLWAIFSNAGAVLTYIAAARGGPTHDAALAAIDSALGFDWAAWYNFLAPHVALRFILWLGYLSLMPQILVPVIWFSLRDLDYFNYELLLNNIVCLLIATALFLLFPALGPLQAGGQPGLPVLLALRGGGALSFEMTHLQGLISFPSYHMVLAVLLVWAHRRSPLLIPIALVNLVMVVSIPTFGPHYLIDIVAGAMVATSAILATAVTNPARRDRPIAEAL